LDPQPLPLDCVLHSPLLYPTFNSNRLVVIWLVLFFSTLEGDQTTSRLGLKEIKLEWKQG